jgi:hypothetical protein
VLLAHGRASFLARAGTVRGRLVRRVATARHTSEPGQAGAQARSAEPVETTSSGGGGGGEW